MTISITKNDKEEFASLYDAYFDKVFRFIYYKTYHKETAEDLTSATFLKALDNFNKYDPGKAKISTWLFTIARNIVIDHFRKKQNSFIASDIWDIADPGDTIDAIHEKNQIIQLQKILKRLSGEQRDILIMRIWESMPYKEIAEILGKSEAACKMSFGRIIALLKSEVSLFTVIWLFTIHPFKGN